MRCLGAMLLAAVLGLGCGVETPARGVKGGTGVDDPSGISARTLTPTLTPPTGPIVKPPATDTPPPPCETCNPPPEPQPQPCNDDEDVDADSPACDDDTQ